MKAKFYEMVQETYTHQDKIDLFVRYNNREPKDMDEFWDWLESICF